MIYIIDHNDSFTHNVIHQFENFDNVECDNFDNINKKNLDRAKVIVFSPGPGGPKDYPMSSKIYNKFKGQKKIIGICLGFQQILFSEKAKIIAVKSSILLARINHFFSLELLRVWRAIFCKKATLVNDTFLNFCN